MSGLGNFQVMVSRYALTTRLSVLILFPVLLVVLLALPAAVNAAAVGVVTEFPLPSSSAQPGMIAKGPDGNLWFTEQGGDKVGRITTAGVITEFSAGITSGAVPFGIAAGPDGNLWFTEYDGNRIGRITPSGVVTEFAIPTPRSGPNGITAGPDGNLWFTGARASTIGRITTAGLITEFRTGITPGSEPSQITTGPDGNLWFTEPGVGQVARITPAGQVAELTLSNRASAPSGITVGADGNLWIALSAVGKLARLTLPSTITEFSRGIPGQSGPRGIATGPLGNLWFTLFEASSIGRFTATGFDQYSNGISSQAGPSWIAQGPQGNMWFTEENVGKIGRITTGYGPPLASVSPASGSFGYRITGAGFGSPLTFTVSDNGDTALIIGGAGPTISGADASQFQITGGTCAAGGTVAVGGSCTVIVAFGPNAAGSAAASLEIPNNAAGSPLKVALSGTGVAVPTPPGPGLLSLSPTAAAFATRPANAGPGPEQSFVVADGGGSSLTIAAGGITIGGTNRADFRITGGTCSEGETLAPGAACSVTAAFAPLTAGAKSGALSVATNASGTSSASLTGTATTAAQFTIRSTSVSGSAIRTVVNAPGAGVLSQTGTRLSGGRRVTACRAARRILTAAGKPTIICNATAATRAARHSHAVRVRLRTVFLPSGGLPRVRFSTIVLKKTGGGVTG